MKKIIGLFVLLALLSCSGSTTKKSKADCSNSALYGYVTICLPAIDGMTECRSHPNVQKVVEPYLASGPVLGYYLNNETYKQIDRLGEISYNDYFMIYGDYQRENYTAQEADLEYFQKELEQTLFEGTNFEAISSKVEESYGTITAGKPALIERYSPRPGVRTLIVLMKYKNKNSADGAETETSVISAVDFILVKQRAINLVYYLVYDGGKSIDALKDKNNAILDKLFTIN